jgi:hypothetical protein
MARKQREEEEARRLSRKEVLLERKERRQNRQVYTAVGAIVALLAVVLVAALISEFLIRPRQPVAVVNGQQITIREWQNRVVLQRAQLIMSLEDLTDTFDGNIGLVQQYAGQQINILMDAPTLAQIVLDSMIEEQIVRQEAEARGITVSEADVQAEIEANYNYFGGDLPTPMPTPTETVVPTPSLTPIPTAVLTEVVAVDTPAPTPTLGPTATPLPTATAVSEAGFRSQYQELIGRLRRLGVDEASFREAIRANIYRERLMEMLATEAELPTRDEHASFYYLRFDNAAEANEAQAQIATTGFLPVWNTIRSLPRDVETPSTASAGEILWRTRDNLATAFPESLVTAVFTLPLGTTSDVLVQEGDDAAGQPTVYYLIQPSGREMRELSEAFLQREQQQYLANWVEGRRLTGVETFERWRLVVPRQPMLDLKYLQPQPEQQPPLIPNN